MKILLVIAGFFLFASSVSAEEACGIFGRVVDAESGLPLDNAHVSLVGTTRQVAADEMGRFSFESLQAGTYTLKATYVSHAEKTVPGIIVTAGSPTRLIIHLSPEQLELPEVLIEAEPVLAAGIISGGTIVSGERLRRSHPQDIADALEKEGIATITSSGLPGGKCTVSLRGSSSDQVLVLLDGQPLNQAADGTADLSQISLSEIQQVEVYPQAPPSLGAQAIGGVINVVTLNPGVDHYRLETGISQFGMRRAALTIGQAFMSWRILGVVEHQESSGEYQYQVIPDDGLEIYTRNVGETLTRHDAAYRRDYLTFKINPPGAVQFGYRQISSFRQNPDYLPEPVLEHESTSDDVRRELSLRLEGNDAWYRPEANIKFEAYHQSTLTDYGSGFPLLYNLSELTGEGYSASLKWHGSALKWHDVNMGLGARWDRLWSAELEGDYADRWHQFGYLQVQGTPFEDWTLPVRIGLFTGVRADVYRDEETFVYPRLGLEIGRKGILYWSIRGELAGAYKLPTFNALFWQEDLQAEGNPNLKPERSQNEEIIGRLGYKSAEFSLSYFNRAVRDLIYWRLDFDDRWKPLNIAESWIYGTEYAFRIRSGDGVLSSNFSVSHRWMRAINKTGEPNTDGNLLPYRPVNTTTLSFRQGLRYVTFDLSARWISERYTNEANTKSLSSYKVWDVGLVRQFYLNHAKTSLSVSLRINNLFDENYRIIDAAPVPLREFHFGLTLEFS
jgi:outer membrane receptor for ferrienterochelin and colicins